MGMEKYQAGLQEELWKKTAGTVTPAQSMASKLYEEHGIISAGNKLWLMDKAGIKPPQLIGRPDRTWPTVPSINAKGEGVYVPRDMAGRPIFEEAEIYPGMGKPVSPAKPPAVGYTEAYDQVLKKWVTVSKKIASEQPERYGESLALKERLAKKAPPAGIDKESVIEHYINKFKTPAGVMGEIKIRKPAERRMRLKGLLQAMEIERKRGKLDENDIARIEQTVMTDLGIVLDLQHGLRAAKLAGATMEQLISLIRIYEEREIK